MINVKCQMINVKKAVAQNLNTTLSILQILVETGNNKVKLIVNKKINNLLSALKLIAY